MTALGTFLDDYATLTERVGLIDRSDRGKLALTGAGSKEFLHGQISNDITALTPGHGTYAALLSQKGKMLGDVRVLDTGTELLLDTERMALQELFNNVRRFSIGYDVELHKRTLESGLLSLVGPLADQVAERAELPTPGATEHDNVAGELSGTEVLTVRTDVGLDLIFDAGAFDAVRAALTGAGAVPVSEEAAECVRIESGRPRYGVDLDDSVIPQEAGLNDRAVSFTKGCYVGQETVARLYYKGKPNRELRGLRSASKIPVGTELLYADRIVGTVTSAAESPRFGAIALALVRREAPVGTLVVAGDSGAAEVVALPFA